VLVERCLNFPQFRFLIQKTTKLRREAGAGCREVEWWANPAPLSGKSKLSDLRGNLITTYDHFEFLNSLVHVFILIQEG
jgi:hypothetical protein